jgi:drug/metabolite transporter (DMT)-like permease
MKIALAEIPPWTFRGWSCLIAGLTLLVVARLRSGPLGSPPRAERWGLALSALCNVTLWNVLVAYGVAMVASGHAALLAYTMPLWVALLARLFLGEPITRRTGAALALGLGGIFALLETDLAALGGAPMGALLCLAAAIAWATGTLVQKHHGSSLPTITSTGYQLVLGSLPMLALMPAIEGLDVPRASGGAWLAAAFGTFVSLAFCYFAWLEIVRLVPAQTAAISVLLVPMVGVASGALLLDEPLGARELWAIGCIGSALALTLLAPAQSRRPEFRRSP